MSKLGHIEDINGKFKLIFFTNANHQLLKNLGENIPLESRNSLVICAENTEEDEYLDTSYSLVAIDNQGSICPITGLCKYITI